MTLIVALFCIFLLIVFVFCIVWVYRQLAGDGLLAVKTKTPVPLCKGKIIVRVCGDPRIKPQDFSRKPIFPPPAPKPKTRVTKT